MCTSINRDFHVASPSFGALRYHVARSSAVVWYMDTLADVWVYHITHLMFLMIAKVSYAMTIQATSDLFCLRPNFGF